MDHQVGNQVGEVPVLAYQSDQDIAPLAQCGRGTIPTVVQKKNTYEYV